MQDHPHQLPEVEGSGEGAVRWHMGFYPKDVPASVRHNMFRAWLEDAMARISYHLLATAGDGVPAEYFCCALQPKGRAPQCECHRRSRTLGASFGLGMRGRDRRPLLAEAVVAPDVAARLAVAAQTFSGQRL